MADTTITLTHERASDFRGTDSGMPPRLVVQHFENLLAGALGGSIAGATSFTVSQTTSSGTITISGGSGSVGAIINGITVAVTASGGDTATAAALAQAINASANPLVNKHVRASSSGGVVTLRSMCAGYAGNAITTAATGTGATASGARLTGGVATDYTF